MSNVEAQKRREIFNNVFHSHYWGDRNNGGKNYKRPYSKTNSSAKEYMAGTSIGPNTKFVDISGKSVSNPVPFGSN